MRGGGGGGRFAYLPCRKFFLGKSSKCEDLALCSSNTTIILKASRSHLGPCLLCPQVHRCVCLTLERRASESFLMSEATLHSAVKKSMSGVKKAHFLQHTFDMLTSIH